ncbi:MAG: TldD/PmbA family protein [Acidimicrobiia bacterium]|nr:TldD/PmbA family protein [Acidimicrobiia bacterium]
MNTEGTTTSTDMNTDELLSIARKVVEQARSGEEIEVACSRSRSTSIKAYQGEVESLTTAENLAVGVRVLVDGREGFASAGSINADVVEAALADARDNARFAEVDPHAGIARPDGVEPVDIDQWRDGVDATPIDDKIAVALEVERRIRGYDPRITGVRTVRYGDSAGAFALASTSGIEATTVGTSASVSAQALAADGDRTQISHAYDGGREPADLDLDFVVERTATRVLDLLGATKPKTARLSLVLDPYGAATVIGLIAGTLSGLRVIRGRSPFADRRGETIAAPILSFGDDATDPESFGADSHDGEGLACRPVPLVNAGVLQGFFHDSYTGRRSGDGSTGSAVRGTRGLPSPGLHALHVGPGEGSLDELIAGTESGLLVYTLDGLHSGVNSVSGDFSVGASGRMIRNGELAEPVSECTIASTLQRLLLDISRIGGDVEHLPSGTSTPPLVIDNVTLSGSN